MQVAGCPTLVSLFSKPNSRVPHPSSAWVGDVQIGNIFLSYASLPKVIRTSRPRRTFITTAGRKHAAQVPPARRTLAYTMPCAPAGCPIQAALAWVVALLANLLCGR
jgi:hypothetical protein